MRALIHELPYERPIAAGRYHYVLDGEETAATESWRLSAAPDDHRFLRVDVNNAAAGGDNVLFHLTTSGDGRPQRLKFHYFRLGRQVRGDLLFEPELALLARQVDGHRLETQCDYARDMPFWFPSAAGLSLLAAAQPGPGLTLDGARDFDLQPVQLTLRRGRPQRLQLMGGELSARPLTARWAGEQPMLWLDEAGWPVRVQWRGMTATDRRYVRYAGS